MISDPMIELKHALWGLFMCWGAGEQSLLRRSGK